MDNIISTIDMTREDWLRTRQRGIGSSDVGAILGFNPYRTALDVYYEKVSDTVIEQPMNDAMHFGNVLEDVVAMEYMRRIGKKVLRDNKIRVHPEHPFMLANLDRVILPQNGEGRGILEIKTASGFAVKKWETQVPLMYYAQVIHQMYVTGMRWGEFALLIDGREFQVMPFTYDEEYAESQVEKCISFWNGNVLARIPPPSVVADLDVAATMPEAIITARDDIVQAHADLLALRGDKDILEAREEALETRIKEYIGTREVLAYGGRTIATWKRSADSTSLDSKKFKKDLPDIWQKYAITKTGSRRFILKGGNDDNE